MKNIFPKRLKELRQTHHLSQFELSKAIMVSQSSVSNWELGIYEPNLSTLVLIAKYFKVTADYLIGYKDYY